MNEEKALRANILSWSDLFLLIGIGTAGILLWGWLDSNVFHSTTKISADLLMAAYGIAALYLMHRRDKNLSADFESIGKASSGISLYGIRTLIVIAMLGAGFVLSIFVNAAFCYAGFCILK